MNYLKSRLYMMRLHLGEDDGIGVVEMILILVVLVALVMIFKSQLNELVSNIFDSINSKSSGIYS